MSDHTSSTRELVVDDTVDGEDNMEEKTRDIMHNERLAGLILISEVVHHISTMRRKPPQHPSPI